MLELGISATVADVRFVKPLDRELLLGLAAGHEALLVVEAVSIGGVGTGILEFSNREGMLSCGLRVRCLFLPDCFLDHESPEAMYKRAGPESDSIYQAAVELLEIPENSEGRSVKCSGLK